MEYPQTTLDSFADSSAAPRSEPDAPTTLPAPDPLSQTVVTLTFWALAACLLTLVNRFAGYYLPVSPPGSLGGNLVAVPYLLLLLLTLLLMGRAAARLPVSAPFLLVVGLLFAAPVGGTLLLQQAEVFPPAWLFLTANNLFLPLAAALVGAGVGRVIKHPNTLLAAAGFSIFFDIVVVTMGTVAVLMNSGSNLIAAVSVGAGAPVASGGPTAVALRQVNPLSLVTIGPADILFIALFFSAVYRMNLSRRATFWWMFGLLGTALTLVQITALPVPALVPMGVAVLAANLSHAAFTPQEKRDLKIGAAFAVFCAVLIVVGARTFLPGAAARTAGEPPRLGFVVGRPEGMEGEPGPLTILRVRESSPAAAAGLQRGDEVVAINGELPTDEQFNTSRAAVRERGGLTLTIRRASAAKPLVLEIKAPRGG
ncbi:MAG: PDZ domain-containing protein [Cytophagales bacterium]|nr:PDZ domain-containing protein [Armatimonadota bacterium]